MNPLDQPLHACRALVVDGQPISRSTLSGMLRDLGVGQVTSCNRPSEAQRLMAERGGFDFVLCEQHFEGGEPGGQELLDDLRRTRQLPFWTVFIIVTAEATHAKVSEAAESSLDGYLVKPATTTALGDRISQARKRKQALQDIFVAIDAGRLEQAALLCLKRFTERADYFLYAARIGAEVLLRLGKPEAARKFFEAIREVRQVPWGSLGIARAEADAGANHQARRTIENLIADNPGYADAHDLMGRIHVDQGDFAGALATYRTASALTPRSLTRLQKEGTLAFYVGDVEEAEQVLDRAVALDAQSRMFDLQTLALLALLKYERGDAAGLNRVQQRLATVQRRHPQSRRIERMTQLAGLLRKAAGADVDAAGQDLLTLAGQRRDDDFDVEAGSNLVALIARLHARGIDTPEAASWGTEVGLRFCVSNAATELMCGAARGHDALQGQLRQAHVDINTASEQAITLSRASQGEAAVQMLLLQGGETLNARLLDLAGKLLQRHGSSITTRDQLAAQATQLLQRYCSQGTRLPLSDRGREAGALSLNF